MCRHVPAWLGLRRWRGWPPADARLQARRRLRLQPEQRSYRRWSTPARRRLVPRQRAQSSCEHAPAVALPPPLARARRERICSRPRRALYDQCPRHLYRSGAPGRLTPALFHTHYLCAFPCIAQLLAVKRTVDALVEIYRAETPDAEADANAEATSTPRPAVDRTCYREYLMQLAALDDNDPELMRAHDEWVMGDRSYYGSGQSANWSPRS